MPFPTIVGAASRRQTLALGLLALAGVHGEAGVKGKGNKRRRKTGKCDRQVERAIANACGTQAEICVRSAGAVCERSRDLVACQDAVRQCCGLMGTGDLEGYLVCMDDRVTSLIAP